MIDSALLIRSVLQAIGPVELDVAKRAVGSTTLRRAMRLIIAESESRANLFIPQFWAIYYHDGRGAISPRSARKLVFFDNPNDDPRLEGGETPPRVAQLRRLTRSQYQDGLRRNQERRAQGLRPFMYVVDRVGPQAPRPFFDEIAVTSAERLGPIAAREFDREFTQQVFTDPATRSEKKTATFFL